MYGLKMVFIMKKITRAEAFDYIVKARSFLNSEQENLEFIRDYCDAEEIMLDLLTDAVKEKYKGVTNGFLIDVVEMIGNERVEVIGEVDNLFACPCCLNKTLTELYDSVQGTGYDICIFCSWEDDGTSEITAYSSVNRGSLADYRENLRINTNYYSRDKWVRD